MGGASIYSHITAVLIARKLFPPPVQSPPPSDIKTPGCIYEESKARKGSVPLVNGESCHVPYPTRILLFWRLLCSFFFIFQIFFLFQGRFLIKKPSVLYVQTWAFHPSNTHTYIPTAYRQTCRIDMRRAERTIDVVRNKELPGPVPARPLFTL